MGMYDYLYLEEFFGSEQPKEPSHETTQLSCRGCGRNLTRPDSMLMYQNMNFAAMQQDGSVFPNAKRPEKGLSRDMRFFCRECGREWVKD